MIAVLALTTNCAILSKTSTEDQKTTEIRNLCYAAASIGTQVALEQKPEWRSQFDLAYSSLDSLINNKAVTGILLRQIISGLPVKELKSSNAKIAIEGATVLYDTTVGNQIGIENNVYILAAATGIRDGLKSALGYK